MCRERGPKGLVGLAERGKLSFGVADRGDLTVGFLNGREIPRGGVSNRCQLSLLPSEVERQRPRPRVRVLVHRGNVALQLPHLIAESPAIKTDQPDGNERAETDHGESYHEVDVVPPQLSSELRDLLL